MSPDGVVVIPYGPRAPGRTPGPNVARRGIDAAVVAALPRKPRPAPAIERQRVQVGAGRRRRQLPHADRVRFRIDAHDRVLSAIGDPGRTVGADDHAVRRGIPAERNLVHLAGSRIEDAQLAGHLRRVVDRPAGFASRGDVVRMSPGGDGEIRRRLRRSDAGGERQQQRDGSGLDSWRAPPERLLDSLEV